MLQGKCGNFRLLAATWATCLPSLTLIAGFAFSQADRPRPAAGSLRGIMQKAPGLRKCSPPLLTNAWFVSFIFPEIVWAKGSSNSGGLSKIFNASYLKKIFWGGTRFWNNFSKIISIFYIIFMLTSANKNHSKIIYAPVTRWWGKIIFRLQKLKHLEIILSKQLKAPQAPQNNFSVGQGKLFHRVPTV